jgi:CheY-like chemotaxis protein
MGQEQDIDETRLAGFDAHVTKPAEVETLLRIATSLPNNVVAFSPDSAKK